MIKKTWIIPHKAFEIFGWTFLDSFDVLKLYLYRVPAEAAEVRGSHLGKKSVCVEKHWKEKYTLQFKTPKGE